MKKKSNGAKKFDGRGNGGNYKLRHDLIPPEVLDYLAEIYTIGAAKYGDTNYEKGMAWSRVIGAAKRHINAWHRGEKINTEDGSVLHLSNAMWCLATLIMYEKYNLGVDDRFVTRHRLFKPTAECADENLRKKHLMQYIDLKMKGKRK